jgi:hypothetical protein
MSKSRRFPGNFFKSFREDPILDDSVGLMDLTSPSAEEDQVASLAAIFSAPFGEDAAPAPRSKKGAAPESGLQARDYVVNSIFAPPQLRQDSEDMRQQLVFIKEHEGALVGIQEVNALMRTGWRVINAFATGNSAFYKALVLLERPS